MEFYVGFDCCRPFAGWGVRRAGVEAGGCVLLTTALLNLSSYKGGENSCSTSNAFRTARMVMSSRTGNGVVRFGVRRKRLLGTKRRIKYVSALRLCLGGVRLLTDNGTVTDGDASVGGRVTTAGRRVNGTRCREGHARGLLGRGTTARGRVSSVSSRVTILGGRLRTRVSALRHNGTDVARRDSTCRVRMTRLSSRLHGYRVADPVYKAMLTGCTRTKRLTARKGPLFGITSIRRLFLHTCVATSRLSRLGLKSGMGIFSSLKGSSHQRCRKAVA